MGGGASTIMMNSPREGMVSEVNNVDAGTVALDRRLRRQRIFEKGEANPELDINVLLDGEYIDEATRKTLIDALGGFYFLRGGTKDPKMDMLLRAMQKEVFEDGFLLINEGEPGSKLYIVDTGELEVTINGEKIRDMGKGSMLGELALLYDAPRSATVRCKTKCVLWSLKREVFKQIQAVSASQIQMQRARWLINSPDLAVLSAIDFSRLVGTLQGVPFRVGEPLYKEGAVTSQILIVEKGIANVYTSKDLSNLTKDNIDKHLGIIRPRSRSSKSEDQLSLPVPSNKVRRRCVNKNLKELI
jgi:CRP-like cAMP-binding protein